MAVKLLCHSSLQNQLGSLLFRNLIRFFGRSIKLPYYDVTRYGRLGRMGTFSRFKTSNNERGNIDRQQSVFLCVLRPTTLVWSGMPVSARAAKTLICRSMLCKGMALRRN
jgi:hypothetical protein